MAAFFVIASMVGLVAYIVISSRMPEKKPYVATTRGSYGVSSSGSDVVNGIATGLVIGEIVNRL